MEMLFFFSSRRRHTRCGRDWSSDVCSSDLVCACLLGLGKHNQNVVLVHIGPIAHDNFLNRSGLVKLNGIVRSEEHTSELQSRPHLVCRLLLEKKNKKQSKQLSPKA